MLKRSRDLVVLEKTQRHNSQANPAERAVRTLDEQVKVMRLDFKHRMGMELVANSCLWPWLIRHAGWVDAWFRKNSNETNGYQDACDSRYSSELLLYGELVLDVQINIERFKEVTVVWTKVSGVVDSRRTHHTPKSQRHVDNSHVRSASFHQVNVLTSVCWHERKDCNRTRKECCAVVDLDS